MDYSISNLSNEDRLFLAVPPSRPVSTLTVVGGKVVASSHGQFPVNGQQLMMQLDSLTSAMMDMEVTVEEDMEVRMGGIYRAMIYSLFKDLTEKNIQPKQTQSNTNHLTEQQVLQQQLIEQKLLQQQQKQQELMQQQEYQLQQQQQLLPYSSIYLSLCNF